MELTTKAEPILGEFKGLRRLLWQLILAIGPEGFIETKYFGSNTRFK